MHFQAHLLDIVGEAIVATDLEDKIIYWNRFAEELYGWTMDEAVGSNAISLLKPQVEGEHAARIAAKANRGESWSGDIVVQRRDGVCFSVAVTNSPIYDDAGALLGFVGVSKDISERRQAEVNLRDSEERFRLLLENVQDYAIYMLDPQGYVTSWNSGAQRLKGYEASEIIGQHFSRFYLPEDVANGKDKRALEIATRQGSFEEEGQRMRKNGEIFWANVSLTAVWDESGVLRGFSKVTRDITERKLAREALERTNREILTIWESMTDAFVALDNNWIIRYANEQAEVLWKRKREEGIGKNFWEFFPEAVDTIFYDEYHRALEEQVAVTFEAFYSPLDYWLEIHAYPSALGLSIYFRDVTERRKAEETLRQSEALHQSIVANAPGMVYQYLLNADGSAD
ncbi:MAG: PAS domain S-box protein, partial [Proteobacteria bacterium]